MTRLRAAFLRRVGQRSLNRDWNFCIRLVLSDFRCGGVPLKRCLLGRRLTRDFRDDVVAVAPQFEARLMVQETAEAFDIRGLSADLNPQSQDLGR